MLYLIPGDNNSDDNPWVVERVIGDDGKPLSKEEIQDWRSHITELWPRSFLRKSLVQCNITHTNNVEDIASDKSLGIQTKAIEVVHLRRHSDKAITGMIALLMLLPNAVNKSQRKQLRTFSHFIGALIETQGNIKDLLDEKRLAEQEAVLGQALGQFRHTLRNRFSLLTNALGEAERRGVEGEWLQRAWRVLKDIDNDIDHARNLVKIPEFRDFDVVDVWNQVVARFSPRAQNKRIELSELAPSESVFFNSDPDIVALILENLVMNAIEWCDSGDFIYIQVDLLNDSLHLTIRNSGQAVLTSVRSKLFEAGVTTKPNGTGFGLYFSRKRARDLNGNLILAQNQKPGAAFTLILPK